MILVAGPYQSGTNGDPELIQANVDAMTATSLELYRRGHLPVMGEWFALPLIEAAEASGDANAFEELFHPIAERVLARCDACLRIGGASSGPTAWSGSPSTLERPSLPASPTCPPRTIAETRQPTSGERGAAKENEPSEHQNGAADAPLSRGSRRSPLFGSSPLTGGNETAPTKELPHPVPVSDPVESPALGPALTPAPRTLPPPSRVVGRVSSRVLSPVSGPVTIRVAPPLAPRTKYGRAALPTSPFVHEFTSP